MAAAAARRMAPAASKKESNLFSLLKNSMGKDLSSITMPVEWNEPLSFLQRVAEYLEYAHLLRQADDAHDPLRRMQLVCAFAVSALASNRDRLRKPFNPLLGETFQLDTGEFRLLCEQVSHHPPVSAFHAEAASFAFFGEVAPRLRFWGKSLDIKPQGRLHVKLHSHNEVYSWSNVNCCVHNIVVGKLWFEQYGSMEVEGGGLRAQLHFSPGRDVQRVHGFALDAHGHQLGFLYGRWTEFLDAASVRHYEEHRHLFEGGGEEGRRLDDAGIPGAERLWTAHPRPTDSDKYYNFTSFALSLNEPAAEEGALPPTDSRLRPDMRRLEEGDAGAAAAEKIRLEELQREARRDRKRTKQDWRPRWFRKEGGAWVRAADDGYWDGDFADCPHIFC